MVSSESLLSDEAYMLEMVRIGNDCNVKRCIKNGVNVNCANVDGDTPLHLAAFASNVPMLICLLDSGADTSAKNLAGLTPEAKFLMSSPILHLLHTWNNKEFDRQQIIKNSQSKTSR